MATSKISPLGLSKREIKDALKRYEHINEHHAHEPPCSFYEWEQAALTRMFSHIKDDPEAVALLCHMIQFCIEKDQVAAHG